MSIITILHVCGGNVAIYYVADWEKSIIDVTNARSAYFYKVINVLDGGEYFRFNRCEFDNYYTGSKVGNWVFVSYEDCTHCWHSAWGKVTAMHWSDYPAWSRSDFRWLD